jgi:5-methylcytosine-specific restriction endonuclease McrA
MSRPRKYFTEEERRAAQHRDYSKWLSTLSSEKLEARKVSQRNGRREAYTAMRAEILKKFGSKCALCGYNADTRALQIDHVGGNGRQERRRFGWYSVYLKVLSDQNNEYQLLCANCNYIKRYDNDEVHLVNASLKSSNSRSTNPA